jgi:CheY-like chemotaxis protein
MSSTQLILLVEDEPHQAELISLLLREEPEWEVKWCPNGEDAVAYLGGQPPYEDRTRHPRPFLLLLDLVMPGIGGLGVLRWLRDHPEAERGLTKVVHSSVDSSREIEMAAELGAGIYWVKSDWANLRQRIKLLKSSLEEMD